MDVRWQLSQRRRVRRVAVGPPRYRLVDRCAAACEHPASPWTIDRRALPRAGAGRRVVHTYERRWLDRITVLDGPDPYQELE
ncbi:MAG: hypothetical protein ACK4V6_19790, partial [Microthrixaceae bacterium]